MDDKKQTGIVLEGGGLRGMFTSGILDVFMYNRIKFDALTGVSAGVLFGCNFKSMQPGRAYRYNLKFKDDKRYMSWNSLFKTGNYVNTKFAYYEIPYNYDPFDFDTYSKNPMKFYAVCTDIESGLPVYHEIPEVNIMELQWLQASSSMPIFAQPVSIGDHYYLDGGITDSIPLRFMQDLGYKRNVVVMTQPYGYRKKKAHLKFILKHFLKEYPKVAELMSNRHIMYNEELDYVRSEMQKGDTLVIYPDESLNIGRLKLDGDKMKAVYDAGVKKGMEMLPQIRDFLYV